MPDILPGAARARRRLFVAVLVAMSGFGCSTTSAPGNPSAAGTVGPGGGSGVATSFTPGAIPMTSASVPVLSQDQWVGAAGQADAGMLGTIFELAGIDDELGADAAKLLAATSDATRAAAAPVLTAAPAATPVPSIPTGTVRPATVERGRQPSLHPAALGQQPPVSMPLTGGTAYGVASAMLGFMGSVDLIKRPGAVTMDRGRMKGTVKIDVPPVSITKWTMTRMSLSLTIDLLVCPDANGAADGTIELHTDLEVTGGAVPITGKADLAASVSLAADDEAFLAYLDPELNGDISGAHGATKESVHLAGIGVTMNGRGKQVSVSNVRGQMQATNIQPHNFQPLQSAIVGLVGIVGALAGYVAEDHWRSGKCIELSASPASPHVMAAGSSVSLEVRGKSSVDGADVHGKVEAEKSAGEGTVDPSKQPLPDPGPFTVTPATNGSSIDVAVSLTSKRGLGVGTWRGTLPGYKVDVNLSGMAIKGEKCDGVEGDWRLVVGGGGTGAGMSIQLSGTIDVHLGSDGTGTYAVHIAVSGAGLPAGVTAGLGVDGQGKARLDGSSSSPALELLDGVMSGTASGAGGGASLTSGLPKSAAGTTAIPVTVGC